MTNFIINSTWSTERRESTEEETIRIVEAAARIIRSEIREMKFDTDCYPGEDKIKDIEEGFAYIP